MPVVTKDRQSGRVATTESGNTAVPREAAALPHRLARSTGLGAAVGVYYRRLRHRYGSLMRAAQPCNDIRTGGPEALELNDSVLQGLIVAKLALELGQRDKATAALDNAIRSASTLATNLLATVHPGRIDDEILPSTRANPPNAEPTTW